MKEDWKNCLDCTHLLVCGFYKEVQNKLYNVLNEMGSSIKNSEVAEYDKELGKLVGRHCFYFEARKEEN